MLGDKGCSFILCMRIHTYTHTLTRYHNVDISVAVSTDGGLITPIVKNADTKVGCAL